MLVEEGILFRGRLWYFIKRRLKDSFNFENRDGLISSDPKFLDKGDRFLRGNFGGK